MVLSTAFACKVVLRRYVCLVGIYCWAITQHLFFILSTSFHEKHKQMTSSRVHSFGGSQNMQHDVTMNTRSIEEKQRKGKKFVVLYHIALWGTALRADHNSNRLQHVHVRFHCLAFLFKPCWDSAARCPRWWWWWWYKILVLLEINYSQRARVPLLLKKVVFSASSHCWWDSASALSTIMDKILGFNAFIVMLYCMKVSIGLVARLIKALVYEPIGWWFESDWRRFFFILEIHFQLMMCGVSDNNTCSVRDSARASSLR